MAFGGSHGSAAPCLHIFSCVAGSLSFIPIPTDEGTSRHVILGTSLFPSLLILRIVSCLSDCC